jgi:hypothetical protein
MKTTDPSERQRHRQNLACQDFRLAKDFAQHLIKKKWHKSEWTVRPTTRIHQTAYTTAFVVTYCRPFTRGEGWKILNIDTVGLTAEERSLHKDLLDLRHKVHAHTDHEKHDRELWTSKESGKPFYIISRPPMHLDRDQLERSVLLIDKLIEFFHPPLLVNFPSAQSAGSVTEKGA